MARSAGLTRLLILGGTGEAAALARSLASLADVHTITSLAGRTRAPLDLPGKVRIGGFGGSAGLARYLQGAEIDGVIDATHPFAARIKANAAAACASLDLPRLCLHRPPWPRHPDDRWIEVDDAATAASRLAQRSSRAFLTIGQPDPALFVEIAPLWLLWRSIEPPATALPAHVHWLQARGPFRLDEELALFTRWRIDTVVTKASGGAATYAKIEAARRLSLPVIMIKRPPAPPGPSVASPKEALAHIKRHMMPKPDRS